MSETLQSLIHKLKPLKDESVLSKQSEADGP